MIDIKVDGNILKKLSDLLKNEPDGTCIRLREYTIGSG